MSLRRDGLRRDRRLPYLYLRQGRSAWLLVPGAVSLAVFAWLLTLHPALPAGRTYAAYGGVYVATAIGWLWAIDGQQPDRWDTLGALLCLAGMAVIYFGPRHRHRDAVARAGSASV